MSDNLDSDDETKPSWRRTIIILGPIVVGLATWIGFAADFISLSARYGELDTDARMAAFRSEASACRTKVYPLAFSSKISEAKEAIKCAEFNLLEAAKLGDDRALQMLSEMYRDDALSEVFDESASAANVALEKEYICKKQRADQGMQSQDC